MALIRKQLGFKHKNLVWNRSRGELIDVITLQKTNYGVAKEVMITGNAALVIPEFRSMMFGIAPSFVIEADGIFTFRFSDLIDDDFFGCSKDRWWSLTAETMDIVGDELQKIVLGKAVPLFNSVVSYGDFEKIYQKISGAQTKAPYFKISKALIHWKLGDLAKFEEELSSIKAWPEKVAAVRQQIAKE